jgi:hypothetical protein
MILALRGLSRSADVLRCHYDKVTFSIVELLDNIFSVPLIRCSGDTTMLVSSQARLTSYQ